MDVNVQVLAHSQEGADYQKLLYRCGKEPVYPCHSHEVSTNSIFTLNAVRQKNTKDNVGYHQDKTHARMSQSGLQNMSIVN